MNIRTFLCVSLFAAFIIPSVNFAEASADIVVSGDTVRVEIPLAPLGPHSLLITTHQPKSYEDWTDVDHSDSYALLRKTAAVWKRTGVAEQYLVYGKASLNGGPPFKWEIVPYTKSVTRFGRKWSQLVVLWRIFFGGAALSEIERAQQLEEYRNAFQTLSLGSQESIEKVAEVARGNDPFCNDEVIDTQFVLKGRLVNVVYNRAPIGFGGEKLHFMFVPKAHRTTFADMSEAEYVEAAGLAQKLINHFSESRPIHNAYLYHKSGVDAGQSVPHWHMHLVLTSSKTQDFFGKLSVLKNMLIRSTPLQGEELIARVLRLREELGADE